MTTEESSRRKSRKKPQEEEPFSLKREIISWIQIIVAAVIIALVLNNFIIANSRVPTGSMENTIMSHSRVIGSRLSYLKEDPERGDVIIFHFPDDPTGKTYYVKRVIGLPGETVTIVDGKVYINDSQTPLEEPYLGTHGGLLRPLHSAGGLLFHVGGQPEQFQGCQILEKSVCGEGQDCCKGIILLLSFKPHG